MIGDQKHFAEAYCEWDGAVPVFRTPGQAHLVFEKFCEFMAQYLIEHKTLDLGFAKIYAVCAPSDWKELVEKKRSVNGSAAYLAQRHRIRFADLFLNFDEIGWRDEQSQSYRWTFDLVTMPDFRAKVRRRDMAAAKNDPDYEPRMLHFLDSNTYKFRMYESFQTYRAETHDKIPRTQPRSLASGDDPGQSGCVPQPYPVGPQSNGGAPAAGGSEPDDVAAEDAGMLTLQALQPYYENMWDEGEDVDCVKKSEAGAGGLPLLHAAQGNAGGKLLAGGTNGGNEHGGLAEGTQQLPDQSRGGVA